MSRPVSVLALGAALLLTDCFRTRYINLAPHPALEAAATAPTPPQPKPHSSWQHFYLWGWVPSERVIPAAEICGGREWVQEIRTEQRFVQRLIEDFAGYYVNIYAPYDGRVVCSGDLDRE
jgi:hypothetical protein